jgi:hypothetical protein
MAILSETDLRQSHHALWLELAERHRQGVQHAAAFALFDDVRPEWEAWLATHPAPPPAPSSTLVAGLLGQATVR